MPDNDPLDARVLEDLARRALENFDLLQWVTGLPGPELLHRLHELVRSTMDGTSFN